ncbi:hypothetical protein I4200191B4_09260 [Pseudoflavonifractor gallinarum]
MVSSMSLSPFYVRGTSPPAASGGLIVLGLLLAVPEMLRQRGGLRQAGGPEEFPQGLAVHGASPLFTVSLAEDAWIYKR